MGKRAYLFVLAFSLAAWHADGAVQDARWPDEDLDPGNHQAPELVKECWTKASEVRDAHQKKEWKKVTTAVTNENFWWRCYLGANAMGTVAERQAFALLQLERYEEAKEAARECRSYDQWNLACRVYAVAALFGMKDSSADSEAQREAAVLADQTRKDEMNASRESLEANYRAFLENRHRTVRRLAIELQGLRNGRKITEPRPW